MDSDIKHDLDRKIRRAITSAIHASEKSRQQIADELSQKLGRQIHLDTLNSWTADSKRERHVPAEVVPALCEILCTDEILDLLESPERAEALSLGRSVRKWLDRKFRRDG